MMQCTIFCCSLFKATIGLISAYIAYKYILFMQCDVIAIIVLQVLFSFSLNKMMMMMTMMKLHGVSRQKLSFNQCVYRCSKTFVLQL